MRSLWRRLLYLFSRERRADELAEEIEFHRALAEQEAQQDGLAPDEAAHVAQRRMGNETLARENARAVWSFTFVDDLMQDLRYGARILARNPRSTLLTIIALALGIGLNAAVFTAYKAMVARPLDARDPHELVNIALTFEDGNLTSQVNYPDYEAYRDSLRSFSGLIAVRGESVELSEAGAERSELPSAAESALTRLGMTRTWLMNLELARSMVVSENYFQVLGETALHGRTFNQADAVTVLEQPSVLISENYWRRRFDSDPDVLGRTVRLNDVAVKIIGITRRNFSGTSIGPPAFWIPASLDPRIRHEPDTLTDRENAGYRMVGRLAPRTSRLEAQAEVESVADGLRALHNPESAWAQPATAEVWPGSPFPRPLGRTPGLLGVILAIVGAAATVFVVACANVAGLQIARARARQGELRTRLSVGAGRARIIRQLVTESVLVAAASGGLALLVAWALLREAAVQFSESMPTGVGAVVFDTTPDLETVAVVFGASVLAGVVSGLAPAMESTRAALAASVRAGVSATRSRRLQDLLVGAQVCLSLVLLIGAGIFLHLAARTIGDPTGYETARVLSFQFRFSRFIDYSEDRKATVTRELRERLEGLPDVVSVSSAFAPSKQRSKTVAASMDVVSMEERGEAVQSLVRYDYVEPNYFETLEIPLLLGQPFEPSGGASLRSVIVSESAAKKLWPEGNPLGRGLRLGPIDEQRHRRDELVADGPAYQVVGVVADKRTIAFDSLGSIEIYLPLPEEKMSGRPLLVRTRGDPSGVREGLVPLVKAVDPDLQVVASTLEEMIRQSSTFAASAMAAALAGIIGSCGLLLALMGIYGTVRYIVVLRTREVGIRIAVGAERNDVLSLVLRESMRPVLAGIVVGMAAAAGGSYWISRLVFGVENLDAFSLLVVSLLFTAIAAAASYAPARRATTIDPMVALREE